VVQAGDIDEQDAADRFVGGGQSNAGDGRDFAAVPDYDWRKHKARSGSINLECAGLTALIVEPNNKAASTSRTSKMVMQDLRYVILLTIGILVAFTVVMTMVAYTVLAERRILGFIQGRLGPNRVGPGGFLQPIADLLKFIFKEDI